MAGSLKPAVGTPAANLAGDRVYDRIILHRDKFKSMASLVADTRWALERFPDMNVYQLILTIELADTNKLGLAAALASLKATCDFTREALIDAVVKFTKGSANSRLLLKTLVRPGPSDGLEDTWNSVNSAALQVFPELPEFQQAFAFFAWMKQMAGHELLMCVNHLNGLAEITPAILENVFASVSSCAHAHSELAVVSSQGCPSSTASFETPSVSGVSSAGVTWRTRTEEGAELVDGAKVYNAFVRAVCETGRCGYAAVWRETEEFLIAGSSEDPVNEVVGSLLAVDESLKVLIKEQLDHPVVFHMTPDARWHLMNPTDDLPPEICNLAQSIQQSIFAAYLEVEFKDYDEREALDWRFEWAVKAHDFAMREAQ